MNTSVAMHMSDGLIDARTSLLFAVIAVAGLGFAAARSRQYLDERTTPMAGLVAAFIFATHMLTFPVLPGVSGHLLGGALAAILVGPSMAALCIGIVVMVQSLLFADGGLTALGANITNLALIAPAAGFLIVFALRNFASSSRGRLVGTAFAAGMFATVSASLGFVLEYAAGGHGSVSITGLALAVVGVHVLIGIGEGLITALTVGAVASARPDLVYLLRGSAARQVATVGVRS